MIHNDSRPKSSEKSIDKNLQKQHWKNYQLKKGISEGFHSIWFQVNSIDSLQDEIQGWKNKIEIKQGCRIGFSSNTKETFPFGCSETSQSIGLEGLVQYNRNVIDDQIKYMQAIQQAEYGISQNQFIKKLKESNGKFFWKKGDKIIINIQLNADNLDNNQCYISLMRNYEIFNLSDKLFVGYLNQWNQNIGQSKLGQFDVEYIRNLKETCGISMNEENKLLEQTCKGINRVAKFFDDNYF